MTPVPADPHVSRLRRLFGPTPADWVRPGPTDLDVLVVGAGQSGIALGFALRRAGITRTQVIDAAGPGGRGVWTTIARMRRLRTPKIWPEPEFGFPELSFRAWYEATRTPEGADPAAHYEALGRIDRLDWAEYLTWVEQVADVQVRHRTRLIAAHGGNNHVRVEVEITDDNGRTRRESLTARTVVLANGVEGSGGATVPAALESVRTHRGELWSHTGDQIDFEALAGLRVAVLGAGASALDAAGTALEAGAAELHLFTRRNRLLIQAGDFGPANLGARENFHRRSDGERWALKAAAARNGRSCTLESVERATAHAGFRIHLDAGWDNVEVIEDVDGSGRRAIRVHADDGVHEFDHLVLGTGYQYDPATHPVLAAHADDIALWRDQYVPGPEDADVADSLGPWPYLGQDYSLQERVPGRAPWLSRVHLFNAGAAMSFGLPVGDVASLATGVPRLVDAIGHRLFTEDRVRELAEAAASSATAVPAPPAPRTPASKAQAPDEHAHLYAHAVWRPSQQPAPASA